MLRIQSECSWIDCGSVGNCGLTPATRNAETIPSWLDSALYGAIGLDHRLAKVRRLDL
jgi:hypothetical protein